MLKLSKASTGAFMEACDGLDPFGAVPNSIVKEMTSLGNVLISPLETTVLWSHETNVIMLFEISLSFAQCTGLLPSPFPLWYLVQVLIQVPLHSHAFVCS